MTKPKPDLDALARDLRAQGATVDRAPDGTPRITIKVGGPGHNSNPRGIAVPEQREVATDAKELDGRLRLLIERVERLEEEKKGIADDIRDVYAESKGTGYDAKIMREMVRLRKMNPDDRREIETITDLYKAALGMG